MYTCRNILVDYKKKFLDALHKNFLVKKLLENAKKTNTRQYLSKINKGLFCNKTELICRICEGNFSLEKYMAREECKH